MRRYLSTNRVRSSYNNRVSGMPEIVEKWGRYEWTTISLADITIDVRKRKPFYKTCASGALLTLGVGYGLDSIVAATVLGVPIAVFTAVGMHDISQEEHTILRNFPVLGHLRYWFESIRPEIRQYFVESDQEASPFTRENRSLVYQRAKGDVDSNPFGSTPDIKYDAARFNISAMSFGAISENAILALNQAAKRGNFYHNTGEGGVSPFHLKHGGDIVWNIGTGYFSCRDDLGRFDPELYKTVVSHPSIKMVEIKLSQGAKPGEGGILPAKKLTKEIAETRKVPMGRDCISPSAHTAFKTPRELIEFANNLREMSQKPVGIKLCIGNPVEFAQVVHAMVESKIYLDFITVDGAAPPEYSNHVGTPLLDGLYIVQNLLVGAGIRDKVKVIASGKIISGFGLFRALSLGADIGNSARGMMFALGCIQALKCHTNKCPTGITTQDKELQKGLVVEDKSDRVYNFQKKTIESCLHLAASAGIDHPSKLNSHLIMVRKGKHESISYAQLRPPLEPGELHEPTLGRREHELRTIWNQATNALDKKTVQGMQV